MKLLLLLVALSCWAAPSVLAGNFVCYFPSWAAERPGNGQFGVADIDPFLCTHIVYSFAVLDPASLTIQPGNPDIDVNGNGYKNFNDLKRNNNTKLKTMIAIGGWVDSNIDDGTPADADKYSRLVSDQNNIRNFVNSVEAFLTTYDFDGLDMDWEYPRSDVDKQGFSDLMKELKGRLGNQQPPRLLSAAIPASEATLAAGYDLREVDRHVDFLNLMAYDMHGSWEPNTADHHAPLYERPADNGNNIEAVVDYLIAQEVTPLKINMGIPTYGRTWKLSSDVRTPPCPASGAGDAGEITGEEGILAYHEICKGIVDGAWVKENDGSGAIGPYAYTPNSDPIQWVGYDDIETVRDKSIYAVIERELGGAMVWDMSMDDFNNVCGDGENPLMKAIGEIVV